MLKLLRFLHGTAYIGWTTFCCIGLLPALLLPPALLRRVLRLVFFGAQNPIDRIFGLRCKVTGRENLPPEPCLIAIQHQSGWETLRLMTVFRDPAIIMKIELTRIPFWGWYASRSDMIPIDRSLGAQSMPAMLRHAEQAIAEGRDITIFPQGTRVPVGERRPFKTGIARLQAHLGIPVVPVALNSGVHATRMGLVKKPGTIELRILPAIMPGLDSDTLMQRLETAIYEESDRMLTSTPATNDAQADRIGGTDSIKAEVPLSDDAASSR